MTEPEQVCPKCGAPEMSDGARPLLFECHTAIYESKGEIDESGQCIRNQLSTLTARLAEVEAERDELQGRIKLQMRTIDGLDNELRAREVAWNSTIDALTAERDAAVKEVERLRAESAEWEVAAKEFALQCIGSNDRQPITHDWLRTVGFQENSLSWSKLLPPEGDGAIIEVTIQEPNEQLDALLGCETPPKDWTLALLQGYPDGDTQPAMDDHVTITTFYPKTRGEVRRFFYGLGRPLTPTPGAQDES